MNCDKNLWLTQLTSDQEKLSAHSVIDNLMSAIDSKLAPNYNSFLIVDYMLALAKNIRITYKIT